MTKYIKNVAVWRFFYLQKLLSNIMRTLCITIILIISAFITVQAQDPAADYDELSKRSTDELMDQGRKYFSEGKGKEALPYFLVVGERYKTDSSEEATRNSIRALNNVGCIFKYFLYDYPQAYEYLTRAYELSEENGYDDFRSLIMVNLGDLYNDYGIIYNSDQMRRKANDFFTESFDKAFENKDWTLLTSSFFNLANHDYEIDLAKYKRIFSKEIPKDTPFIEYVRLQYQGIEDMQAGRYGDARNKFRQQFENVDSGMHADRLKLATYMNIAETYQLEKNYTEAAASLEEALQLSDVANVKDLSANICNQLSELYGKIGDREKQQEYHLQYLEEMESLHNSRLSNIGELNFVNDLKKEEEKARELVYRQRLQLALIIAIAVILVVVVFASVMIWRKNRFLQARNKSLYERYQQLLKVEKEKEEATHLAEENSQDIKEEKYSHSKLNDHRKESLISRIREVMDNPDLICSQDFSSKELAKLVESNTTYVSQVINENYGISFSTLLGNQRVKEACRRINESDRYDNLTIEGIANDVGFKSRTALLTAFKREVGLTPSEYIKMAKEAKK